MSASRISGTVTQTVVLGGQGYPSPLLVTGSGYIQSANYGAIGVFSSTAGVSLNNHGKIAGSNGAYIYTSADNGVGGAGVDLSAGGVIANEGEIRGGNGGGATNGLAAGAAGDGVDIAGGLVTNLGTIQGGAGYFDPFHNYGEGAGGSGIVFGATGTLVNHGSILGGGAGVKGSGPGANGGIGVLFEDGGSLSNSGTIKGGFGSYGSGLTPSGVSGAGVAFATGGTLTNHGRIIGGDIEGATVLHAQCGGDGVDLAAGSVLNNDGVITAGGDGYDFGSKLGGLGGTGVSAVSSILNNTGTITGGVGGDNRYANGESGGAGVLLQDCDLHNAGSITGGSGGYSYQATGGTGGDGVDLSVAGTVLNAATGTIAGGEGGTTRYGAGGGDGGVGVNLGFAALSNLGTVYGGAGSTYNGQNGTDGAGGAGVTALISTVDNGGLIVGGAGGVDVPLGIGTNYATGAGGAGVDLTLNDTLRNTGAIAGGVGGVVSGGYGGTGGSGVIADFGASVFNAGTISGGAGGSSAFFGEVPYGGNGGVGVYLNGGTLTNAGTINGGAGGAGTSTSGTQGLAVQFGPAASTLVLDPGAVFDGLVAANASVNDVLLLASTGGTLSEIGTQFTGFSTLAERPGARWTLGATALASSAEVILRQDASLTFTGGLSGGGIVRLDAGATLTADAGLGAATLRFADGGHETLVLKTTDEVAATLSGFRSSDTIDLASTLTTFSYIGGTLTLLDNTSIVETLTLAGHYTDADFALKPDDHGGTDILVKSDASALHAASTPDKALYATNPHESQWPGPAFSAWLAAHSHTI
jgi:outer membrane protein IcsA